ncbi:MAG: DUF5018 domain-containing protein [Leptospira sp.]|nr:DUF5018 domain-containing protein [Leptospira sp.]
MGKNFLNRILRNLVLNLCLLIYFQIFLNACFLNPIFQVLVFSERDSGGNSNPLLLAGILGASGSFSNKDITAYSIPSLNLTGTIAGNRILLVSDTLTNVSSYTAEFTTTGQKVTIGGVEQISNVTTNSYTSSLTYTVTALDGSTKDYSVFLTAPRSIGGSSLRIWLKADAISATNGSEVESWADLSGFGNHFTNLTVSAQPIYQTSRVNGLPALLFTQTGLKTIGTTTATGLYIDNSASFFIVMKYISNAGGAQTVFNIGSTNGRQFDINDTPRAALLGTNNVGWDYTSLFTFPTDFLAFGSVQNLQISKNEIWNGDFKAELRPANGGPSMYSGTPASSYLSAGGMDMEIAELLYFNTFLSQSDVDKIFCYLNTKYNFSSTTLSCNNI